MRSLNYSIAFALCLLGQSLWAQLIENFTDGDFISNPAWLGDMNQFVVDNFQLRSNGDTISTSNTEIYLSTPNALINNTQWEFWINPKLATSSNNRIDVFLVSDISNLTSNNHGYFVRIGGTPDEVALFRKDGVGQESYVIAGEQGSINSSSSNPARIKVLRDANGNWSLYADYLEGQGYVPIGSAPDNTYSNTAFFGLLVRYSNSNRIKFFADNFYVGPIKIDCPELMLSILSSDASCGLNNGQLDVIVMGGTQPFSYLWSNGADTPALYNLSPGTYSLTVIDSEGCSVSAQATVVSVDNPSITLSGSLFLTGKEYTAIWNGFPDGSSIDLSIRSNAGNIWIPLLSNQSNFGSASIGLPYTIASGDWLLKAEDSVSGCSAIFTFSVNTEVTMNRIDFHENVQPNMASNPFNTITPGFPLRFKLKVENNYVTNLLTLQGTLRTESPWVAILDSLSAYNNILAGQQAWGVDAFEIMIDPTTPPGSEALFELWMEDQIAPAGPWGCTFTIPLTPFQSNFQVIDDDSNPDSKGDNDDIAEQGETVEIIPMLANSSGRTIHNTSAQLISPYSSVNVWNNVQGANTIVMNTYRYNYAGGNWQPLNPLSSNNIPEEDYVFDYNFEQPFGILLCMIVSGYPDAAMGSSWDQGGVLHRWSACFFMNNGYPNVDTAGLQIPPYKALRDFEVVPNPASDQLILHVNEFAFHQGSNLITISDLAGRVVLVQSGHNRTISVDISNLPSGIYFVSIDNEPYKSVRKVVIQH